MGAVREQFANQMLFEIVESVLYIEKRFLIVRRKADQNVVDSAQRAAHGKFGLPVALSVLFGVADFGVQAFDRRFGFVRQLIGDGSRFGKIPGSKQGLDLVKFGVG